MKTINKIFWGALILLVVYTILVLVPTPVNFSITGFVAEGRLPTIGGDGGNWGSVLNTYLTQEHTAEGGHKNVTIQGNLDVSGYGNFTGNLNVTGNLTLGDKITFRLGGVIDNLVDGWLVATGNLNVVGDLNVSGNLTVKGGINISDSNSGLFFGDGTEQTSAAGGIAQITTSSGINCPTTYVNITLTDVTYDIGTANSTTNQFTFNQAGTYIALLFAESNLIGWQPVVNNGITLTLDLSAAQDIHATHFFTTSAGGTFQWRFRCGSTQTINFPVFRIIKIG